MVYIIAGNLQQAFRYAGENGLSPRDCVMITSPNSLLRLRGRRWEEGDRIEWVGTYFEVDYTSIRKELRIMGAPKELT